MEEENKKRQFYQSNIERKCSIAKLSPSDAKILSDRIVARKKRCNNIRSNINPETQETYHRIMNPIGYN